MLVLSRKVGEKILIGDNISVTIVRVAQGTVRVGVSLCQQIAREPQETQGSRDDTRARACWQTVFRATILPERSCVPAAAPAELRPYGSP